MRADGVILSAPVFNDDFGFGEVVEQLHAQAFIAQFAVETFIVSVLPRGSWLDVQCLRTNSAEPLADSSRSELTSIIGANMIRNAVLDHQIGKGNHPVFSGV